MENLTFADLIDTDSLQMIQDSFAEYTGLALCVIDAEGKLVVNPSGYTDFCDKLTKTSKEGLARCNACDRNGALQALKEESAIFYTCHAGMTDFVIPIVFENRIIGGILAGKVRTDDFNAEKFRQTALELGIDPEEYVEAAQKSNYMSKEDARKTAHFLSEFSKSLSIMAYANYRKNIELQKTERAARSQSSFIIGLTENLHTSVKGWMDRFRTTTEKYMNIPEVKTEVTDLLGRAQDVYSQIGSAVEYIRMAGGSAEYSENVYNIRNLIDNTAASLKKEAEPLGIKVWTSFFPLLPETLAGNSGRIGQIVSKLGSSIISFTKEGGTIELSVSCEKTDYSCNLIIKITGTNAHITPETAEAIQKTAESGGINAFGGEENENFHGLDFPLIVLLVKQMSGDINLENSSDGNATFTLTIPQLDGAKQNA